MNVFLIKDNSDYNIETSKSNFSYAIYDFLYENQPQNLVEKYGERIYFLMKSISDNVFFPKKVNRMRIKRLTLDIAREREINAS